jgi:multimeric flavodoxin WrbA
MSARKVVILDGCGYLDADLAPIRNVLSEVLQRDGSEIEVFPLCEMKLAHCLGCFNCWVKTPGLCVENDAGRQIARAVIQSDTVVLFTPVTFGGYSPDLKKAIDRFVQLASPYFMMDHGEVHHPPRYPRRPRHIVIGVQRRENAQEARIFRALAGRNAINIHPPSYAAEVVSAAEPRETLRKRFEDVLGRFDVLPFGKAATELMPAADSGAPTDPKSPRRALLIVGSPKTGSPSTSGVLGERLLQGLSTRGWETESLTLRASLNHGGADALLAPVDRAGLIVLAFPLYVDALPHLVTKALAVIAAHRRGAEQAPPQSLVAIVNSGFPEARQNAVALAICREFAAQSGVTWAGGLALPGGGMINGQPLVGSKRSGPPVGHVIRSLDLAAAALADGQQVPAQAVILMAKNPIPFVPFGVWTRIYIRFGAKGFEEDAARNGISRDRLMDQPYLA